MSQEGPLVRLVRRGASRTARSLAFLVPFLASAAALAGPSGPYAPPRDVSTEGHRVTWLFWYTTGLGIVAFTLVCASLVYIVARYRARAGHRAVYDKGTDRRSLVVTGSLALLVFLSIDLVLVHRSRADIEEYLFKWPTSADTVRIEVMPQQWAWNFRYPGADGVFNTADDVVTMNEMWIPKGRPVFLNLKAKDVIHSFYLPNFRIKQDAIPGHVDPDVVPGEGDRPIRDRLLAALRLRPLQDEGRPHRHARTTRSSAGTPRRRATRSAGTTRPTPRRTGGGNGWRSDDAAPEARVRRSGLSRRAAHPPRPDVVPEAVRLLARPQGHRQAVPLAGPRLPRDRRDDGDDDPLAAGPTRAGRVPRSRRARLAPERRRHRPGSPTRRSSRCTARS